MSSILSERHDFVHNGQVIYTWEQSLEEVLVDIPLPPGASKKDLAVAISVKHLTVGLKGLPPYLDVSPIDFASIESCTCIMFQPDPQAAYGLRAILQADFPFKIKVSESFWTVGAPCCILSCTCHPVVFTTLSIMLMWLDISQMAPCFPLSSPRQSR